MITFVGQSKRNVMEKKISGNKIYFKVFGWAWADALDWRGCEKKAGRRYRKKLSRNANKNIRTTIITLESEN